MVRKDWTRIALLVLGVMGISLLYVGNAVVTTLAIAQIGLVHSFLHSLPKVRVEEPREPKPDRPQRASYLPSMHQLVTDAKRRRRP